MDEKGHLLWNPKEISKALRINESEVLAYFRDGRRVSFILERRLSREVMKGKLALTEGAGYDLTDKTGGKWEVRSITKGGIYFCSSNNVGKGRRFDLKDFLGKLGKIKGYIISDAESFPRVPYWIISAKQVREWWDSGELGRNSKISRQKALDLISNI